MDPSSRPRRFAATPIVASAALLLVALVTASPAAAEPADPAALLFAQRCATCHTVGEGRKVGPDLLGVTERRTLAWFTKFVRSPGAAIDGGDPVARQLLEEAGGVRMPDQPWSDAELAGLFDYFRACGTKGGCKPVALGPRWGTDGTPEEIDRGRELFFGAQRFARGGAPCFTCHQVRGAPFMGGGSLGPDLTFVYARRGEKGLEPDLAEPSTPVMRAVYGEAGLGEDERFAVKAYLAHLARDGTVSPPERDFPLLGLEGAALVLGAFFLGRRATKPTAPPRQGGPS